MRTHKMLTMALSLAASTVMLATLAAAATVEVKTKEGIGKYLTDEKGMTLYTFKKDGPGKSACAGPCVEKWPLFSEEKVTVPEGLAAADFGVITREDGKKQTTYKGMPLYYFFKDAKAGDAAGQGVNNVWFVVTP
jgi:predicted lipoprotein with Yx(FWY)xxD motif